MGIYINPGKGSFIEAISSDIYVDKTELIKYTNSVIGTQQKYICVSRPRRFGKSITASMLCAYYGDRDIAIDLLKAGADRALKDKEGSTFVDYARRKNDEGQNHEDMIALIEEFRSQEARQ